MIKNINPNKFGLKKNELIDGVNFINQNIKINNTVLDKLTNRNKEIVLSILSYAKKYNIDTINISFGDELLGKMLQSNNFFDIGIANYINNNIININFNNDYKNIEEYSEEMKFFWSVEKGWKPLNVSGNIESILGYSKEDFYNSIISFEEIIHPNDVEKIIQEITQYTKEKRQNFNQKYRIKKKDGTYITIRDKTICKYNKNNDLIYFYGYIVDITEEEEQKEELEKISKEIYNNAITHKKTGLPNLNKLFIDLEKDKNPFLALLKIKDFANINIAYGFNEGDKIIQKIIQKIKQELYNIDKDLILYNIGTSVSFGITKQTNGKFENLQEIDKLIKEIFSNFYINNDDLNININFYYTGICIKEDLFNSALISLYNLKNSKETRMEVEDTEIVKEKSRDNISWINKIIEGIKNDKFYPVYQGIRDNKTGKIDKYESLIRFDNGGTEITPFSFLSYAEKIGKMVDLTKIMLNKVIKEMTNHDKDISINITQEDFLDIEFISYVKKILDTYNVDPNRLIFEILEDISIVDDTFLDKLGEIKDIGIKIAIDDFGIGYSNLERLMKINPDFIKIDGSLIKEIANDKEKREIIKVVKKLASIKNAKTIAEFVDNEEVQKIVEKLGIDYIQGYLFSKPSKKIK